MRDFFTLVRVVEATGEIEVKQEMLDGCWREECEAEREMR